MSKQELKAKSQVEKKYIVSTVDLIKICIFSFFIQATFTATEMLGVGFGFALVPGIKRIAQNPEQFRNLMKRHTEYFNAHPYLSSFILGSVLRLEELASRNTVHSHDIENIKNRLGGVLGSLGDRLFWKYLKPFASITALVILLILRNLYPWNVLVSVIFFLCIFNTFHLYYRWSGIKKGYSAGTSIIRSKSLIYIERINFLIASASLMLLGILFMLEIQVVYNGESAGVIIFLAAAGTAFYFNYSKISPGLGIILGLCISFVLYALIHVTGL